MKNLWRTAVLSFGFLGALGLGQDQARANGHFFYPRAYYAPTTYVETVPTAYVVPSSYFVPTVYLDDAPAYTSTSYVVSPVYSTSYVVPSSRVYISSSYVPTSWVSPPVYDPCCAVEPPCSTPAPARTSANTTLAPARSPTRKYVPYSPPKPSSASEEETKPTPSTVTSVPIGEGTTRQTMPAPVPTSGGGGVDPNLASPPEAPAVERESPGPLPAAPAQTPITPPSGKPPVAPGGEGAIELAPPGEAESVRRQSLKPLPPAPFVRSAKAGTLNILEGKVLSGDTGMPEEGVTVTASNRQAGIADKLAVTDAYGHYAVRLTDGDWTVKVTMPSGRMYAVSQLSVSSGQVSDDLGRDVPTLVITR